MSAPIILWVSTLFSGVKQWREPSIWLLKVQPSSLSLRIPVREKTWKPPLSVSMGLSQLSKRCSPPALRNMSSPGRR